MVAMTNNNNECMFEVVHPLDDVQEVKRTGEGLGLMAMKPAVRFSLLLLRGYLIVMALLVGYHLLDLAGLLGSHLAR